LTLTPPPPVRVAFFGFPVFLTHRPLHDGHLLCARHLPPGKDDAALLTSQSAGAFGTLFLLPKPFDSRYYPPRAPRSMGPPPGFHYSTATPPQKWNAPPLIHHGPKGFRGFEEPALFKSRSGLAYPPIRLFFSPTVSR